MTLIRNVRCQLRHQGTVRRTGEGPPSGCARRPYICTAFMPKAAVSILWARRSRHVPGCSIVYRSHFESGASAQVARTSTIMGKRSVRSYRAPPHLAGASRWRFENSRSSTARRALSNVSPDLVRPLPDDQHAAVVGLLGSLGICHGAKALSVRCRIGVRSGK